MMYILEEAFKQINILLPKDEKVESYSVLPLPYKGYYEVYVQTESKKRFRALVSPTQFLSELTEWELPGGQQNG